MIHHTLINALYPLWIIGFNQDEKTWSNSQLAGLIFQFKDCIANGVYGDADTIRNGGWTASSARSESLHVSGSIYNSFPNIVKASIIQVDKSYAVGGAISTINDFLFYPSLKEMLRSRSMYPMV